ncbi:MAG: MOSC domain-containing protein [Rhodobacteraceae bacterium]|nr:MOSC domain-containing protein [Paracoccaceae bacterium]
MVEVAEADLGLTGLAGDHHSRANGRAVTLIQAEHLPVIAALCRRDKVMPDLMRRNVVVSGINLGALRGGQVRLGSAVIELAAPCAPCSRMETALGPGGYSAMRGHGGWTARVVHPGRVAIGDMVTLDSEEPA